MVTLRSHLMGSASSDGAACTEIEVQFTAPTEDSQKKSRVVKLGLDESRRVELPSGQWRLTPRAAGCWGGSETLFLAAGDEVTSEIDLWPLAPVRGTLEGETPLPDRLRIEFSPSFRATDRTEPSGEIECTIASNRAFICRLPASTLDLRVAVRGFAPRYLWARKLEAGSRNRLPPMELTPGASLSGWLVLGSGEEPESWDPVAVTLVPRGLATATDASERRLRDTMTQVGRIHPNGFFQFDSLATGEFVLRTESAEFAETSVAVQLLESKESQLREPLVLEPPMTVSFVVDPALDAEGRPWTLALSRTDLYKSFFEEMVRGEVPADGWLDVSGLAPTQHMLQVFDAEGQRMVTRFVDLGQETMPIEVRIGAVPVEGRVTLGDEPIIATLWFGGRTGSERVETVSDEDGWYAATLPRSGVWRVDLQAEDPAVELREPGVEIAAPSGHDVVRRDFELPGTRLHGHVRKADGTPPHRATRVYVFTREDGAPVNQRIESEDDVGRFDFYGLPAQPLRVYAWGPESRSAETLVVLREDAESEIELVLKEETLLRGQVLGEAHPIPGARVTAVPAHRPLLLVPTVSTDGEGRFELSLPADTEIVDLSVSAPGRTLGVFRRQVDPEAAPVRLSLPETGGRLVLTGIEPYDEAGNRSILPLVSLDGVPLGRHEVEAWASIHLSEVEENTLVFEAPAMAPGSYTACGVPAGELVAWYLGQSRSQRCVSGVLAPHGELVLELPSVESPR